MPESDARSVEESQEDMEKIKHQALVYDILLPCRKLPESDAWSVEESQDDVKIKLQALVYDILLCRKAMLGLWERAKRTWRRSDFKHWFTTSFFLAGRRRKAMLGVWERAKEAW